MYSPGVSIVTIKLRNVYVIFVVPGFTKVTVSAGAGYVTPCTVAVHQSVCVTGDMEQGAATAGNVKTT